MDLDTTAAHSSKAKTVHFEGVPSDNDDHVATEDTMTHDKNNQEQLYDPLYFDTDSDESEDERDLKGKNKADRIVRTNDELFYDPEQDDRDEEWVINEMGVAPETHGFKTDAILSCPCCLTEVCYSCQRHERYQHQYRAMFVRHCRVIKTERLRYEPPDSRHKRRKGGENEISDEGDEFYFPVECVNCRTRIAVYDTEEVYHFFNVIAS
ncbi:uncharacterized protein VTP21DRAFT_2938 [Calcarisporiella thermophila]|uniref:uncharacterized protein n=1 Tax=Calcarisporiella thermophila TaxID=911321 RepID=UPI003742FD01